MYLETASLAWNGNKVDGNKFWIEPQLMDPHFSRSSKFVGHEKPEASFKKRLFAKLAPTEIFCG
jgi:hypothetical protein